MKAINDMNGEELDAFLWMALIEDPKLFHILDVNRAELSALRHYATARSRIISLENQIKREELVCKNILANLTTQAPLKAIKEGTK